MSESRSSMEPFDPKQKKPRALEQASRKPVKVFPYTHLIVVGALAVALAASFAVPSDKASASRQTAKLAVPEPTGSSELPSADPIYPPLTAEATRESAEPVTDAVLAEPAPLVNEIAELEYTRIEQSVKSGDSLSTIFRRAGLNDKAMLEVVNSCDAGKKLARLYPGHRFIFDLDENGQLARLEHIIDRLNSQTFVRTGKSFSHEQLELTPDIQYAVRSGTIDTSLYNAGKKAQLGDDLIMQMASIFGWDVDFALDIRSGDSFKILFEESFLEGERIGTGRVLAAEFVNQGTTFKAVRYVHPNGKAQYYTPDGKAMQKAFLRAPLDFRRISSNFNPRRLHPIYKTVRPHRGTDYAANRGTPVWASGEGRVVASGYTKANGNYVVIQHGGEIQTKYLHLHKRHVKRGERVKQKQIIGTVGSTGYSTAPHLHYEFLLNGVHRNPRTIVQKLPKAKSIDQSELQRFINQTQPLLAELEQNTRYASLPQGSNSSL